MTSCHPRSQPGWLSRRARRLAGTATGGRRAVEAALEKLQAREFGRRLWERDAGLWKSEPEHQRVIKIALGWLSAPGEMLKGLDQLLAFVEEVRRQGFKHAVLLGMGGSSLCPDV